MTLKITKLELKNVTKKYNAQNVVDCLSLTIFKGEKIALMGPTGAGKSTLLSIMSLTTKSDSGEIFVNDEDVFSKSGQFLKQTGFLSHEPMMYPSLTATENLLFFAKMYNIKNPHDTVTKLIEKFEIKSFSDNKLLCELSRGQRQKAALIRSQLNSPDLVLLDEPFTGLDSKARDKFLKYLSFDKKDDKIHVIVTHNFSSACLLSNRTLILNRGKIVADIKTFDYESELENFYFRTIEAKE